MSASHGEFKAGNDQVDGTLPVSEHTPVVPPKSKSREEENVLEFVSRKTNKIAFDKLVNGVPRNPVLGQVITINFNETPAENRRAPYDVVGNYPQIVCMVYSDEGFYEILQNITRPVKNSYRLTLSSSNAWGGHEIPDHAVDELILAIKNSKVAGLNLKDFNISQTNIQKLQQALPGLIEISSKQRKPSSMEETARCLKLKMDAEAAEKRLEAEAAENKKAEDALNAAAILRAKSEPAKVSDQAVAERERAASYPESLSTPMSQIKQFFGNLTARLPSARRIQSYSGVAYTQLRPVRKLDSSLVATPSSNVSTIDARALAQQSVPGLSGSCSAMSSVAVSPISTVRNRSFFSAANLASASAAAMNDPVSPHASVRLTTLDVEDVAASPIQSPVRK